MSEENKLTKEKALEVANDVAGKAKDLGNKSMEKADELYNKLPLDKLNEKFGGKIDFKSPKVRYGVFALACVIVLLVLVGIFALISSGDPIIPENDIKALEAIIALDDDLLHEYSAVMQVSKIKQKYGEETFSEYVERCIKSFTEQQKEAYKKAYENINADQIRENLKEELIIRKDLHVNGPDVISKKYGINCIKIYIDNKYSYDPKAPWYYCTAIIKGRNGKNYEKAVTLRYFINGHQYIDGKIVVAD